MLYMRLGQEDEARNVLDRGASRPTRSTSASPTSLKVLRHLDKYETLKTEHFVLRYDPKTDAVLASYMADYLEEIYADLAKKFDYQPNGPILIEVFNNHEMFSGRIDRPARPAHDRRLHRPDGRDGVAATARASASRSTGAA